MREKLIEEKPQIFEDKDSAGGLWEHLGPKESEKQLKGLYLINTRLWLDDLSKKYETTITIGSVPDDEWNKLFEKYDNFWFMGIYQPSQKGQEVAKKHLDDYRYRDYLPDIDENRDIVASPFAITEYSPNPTIAKDWQEWDEMVEKLHQRGKKVFIDFVPNHTALDHPWVQSHPEYYVQGYEQLYLTTNNFIKITDDIGQVKYFAYGKDPNYPDKPWTDTLQLNYANIELQEKMRDELIKLSKHTDGFRCDMAMLINPKTFITSWNWCLNLSKEEQNNLKENPFWQKTISEIKNKVALQDNRNIEFIAEAYWDEKELGQWFDYIYNKGLYNNMIDCIKTGYIFGIKEHLKSLIGQSGEIKNRWVIFTENHDEKRATEIMGEEFSKPAAVLLAMIRDSIFMVNQGQESGWHFRPPMQISKFRKEETNFDIARFYDDLLSIRRSSLFQNGEINIIDSTSGDQNSIIFEIRKADTDTRAIVAVNISQWTSFAQVEKDEDHLDIYNLTSGQKSDDDWIDDKNLILKLNPGEVKIVCLTTVAPESSKPQDECVLSEMEPRACF